MDMMGLPPAPDDDGWDEWVEEQMVDVEFDTTLAKEMAEDAFRIVSGDLSKAEFHERYTEAVRAEFGVDERPTKRAVTDEPDEPLPGIPGAHRRTRRKVLQAIGGVAAVSAGSLAGCLSNGDAAQTVEPNDSQPDDGILDEFEHETQLGMVIDTDRCIACLACSQACKEENDTPEGVHWTYVFRWANDQNAEYGDEHDGSMTRPCQHCAEPSCTYVCPTQARFKREEDGVVLTDYDVCIGCRYCQVACPYGVNYFQWDEPASVDIRERVAVNDGIIDDTNATDDATRVVDGIIDELPEGFHADRTSRNGRTVAGSPPSQGVMSKCTFCVHRQDSGDPDLEGTTACTDACPVDAIHFGDINNPNDDPQQHLEARPELSRTRLLESSGNRPSIIYVGPQPGFDSRPVQGPVSYEELGMTEHRREVIDDRFKQEVEDDD